MGDLPETLRVLAECEEKLGDLNREVAELPRLIEEVEGKAAGARATVERERQAIADLERKRRDQDAELQDCETKRDRFRAQTPQVKTNEEYHTLLHEIEQVTQRISDLEEEILVAMEEVDQKRESLEGMEGEQAKTERDCVERAADLRERLERARQEISGLEVERDGFVARLSREAQAHYRRVQQVRGSGTTRLRGRACASCYRDIPYETLNRVAAGELHTCLSCSRILVEEVG